MFRTVMILLLAAALMMRSQVSQGFSPAITTALTPPRTPKTPLWLRLAASTTTSSKQSSIELSSSVGVVQQPKLPDTSAPLPAHTFAGMVEQGIIERFGSDAASRVIKSWRLLDADYKHVEYVGPTPSGSCTTSNNTINRSADHTDCTAEEEEEPTGSNSASSRCHQECHSYVPGLTCKEFWNTNDYPWCSKLAKKYQAIRNEFASATSNMQQLTENGNNVWAGALTDDASSYGVGWKTLVLMNRGVWDPTNVALFPVCAQAIREAGAPVTEVFFASMQAHSEIHPHSDYTNFVLTSHLGVDIPYNGQNKCRLRIGDTVREWKNGEITLFDTSIIHDAVNESDQTRYILMMRVWHPELTETERQALQFTYHALENPGLVSTDSEERQRAQQMVEAASAFPEIPKGTGRKSGFGSGGAKRSGMKKKKR